MALLAVGVSHHEAPLELRERLAIPRARLGEALDRLAEHAIEGVLLSTCNRTELYAAVGHQGSGLRALARFLSEVSGVGDQELMKCLRTYWQEAAVRHLFRVAAGLESMIVGEGQILGQVREAYEAAAGRRSVGPLVARLFDRALVVGKRARTETGVARSAVSVSQAAVELARRAQGGLDQATLLLIGTGKMGQLAARSVRERGAGRVILMNRTPGRASALVEQLGGEAWPLARLATGLAAADIVITSAASERYLITSERVAAVLPSRGDRPLLIVDIAVPRNVEPAVAGLAGVQLYNVDDLREVCAANLEERGREAARVEAIIEDELVKYLRWWQAREVAPTIAALVRKAETIRQDELSRTLGRLGALSERDVNAINAMTRAIVSKMLHAPIVGLKERGAGMDGRHYVHAVRELFDLPSVELAAE
jgi:glutamyl-tRNA reductase